VFHDTRNIATASGEQLRDQLGDRRLGHPVRVVGRVLRSR
jgi:hypothetical protein